MRRIALLLLFVVAVNCQRGHQVRDDDDAGDGDEAGDEGTVKTVPVIKPLPKNRLSPEVLPISSLKKEQSIKASIDEPATEAPGAPARPVIVALTQAPPSPTLPSQIRAPPSPRQPQPQSPLNPAALAAGSGLTNILANNPSLLKLLQGVGGPPGIAGQGSLASVSSSLTGTPGGQSGLLAPLQGSLPSLPTAGAGPPGAPDSGLLNVISSLGRQLGGAVGLNNVIPSGSSAAAVGPSIPRIAGGGGPPIAGIPNIPGLPIFPGAGGITPGGQLDVLQLVSAISRRAFNGTSVTDVLPPNQIQKLADNLTNTLLPDTPDIDLSKYMGRWFEGIGSPRASDQRCVVHHYGGLTENGKTATFTALKIYREASEFGQVRYSIGYAFRGGRQSGMLQMHSSESADPVPYWIYRVGPIGKDQFGNEQYEYAIVSNWIKYPVMVMVRDPDQFKRDHEESVLKWLEEKGFINSFVRAFNLVQPVSYQNCQYADSTFELFG